MPVSSQKPTGNCFKNSGHKFFIMTFVIFKNRVVEWNDRRNEVRKQREKLCAGLDAKLQNRTSSRNRWPTLIKYTPFDSTR